MKTNLANTIRKLSNRISTGNKRRSPANDSNTSSVGGVTSLILCEGIRMAPFGHGVGSARRYGRAAPSVSVVTSDRFLMTPFLCLLISLISAIFVANGASVYATNSTLSLSIDNNTLSVDVIPTSTNGTFVKSDNSTISVTTNNYSGYTLSIAASSSSTDLTGTNGSIASIGSAVSEADFSADTTTAATNYNGKWGYLPSKLNSSTNTSFQPSPGTGSSGHTLDVTSTANTTTPNTYTLAIGARVDSNTPTGSYSNTFVVSAVANLINYTITYNKGNTTDTVLGLPSNTTGTISDPLAGSTNITLSSTEPTRDGYNFLGWCTTNPTAGTGGAADTCSGTTIAASGTYNLNATNNPTVTIYALWQKQDPVLYNKVAAMNKGTQTLAQLRAAITVPTSADRTQDTSNSGVYEYNSSVFGADSDATKSDGTKAIIYYYRGVLENSVGSYGSDGSAVTYPNYVILDADGSKTTADTCWRIVRTTGSGGVKMIYNGKWTGSTCANATTNAQVTTQAFNATSNIGDKSIIATGYTFNANYKTTTGSTAYSTLFGSNSSYSGNSTPSSMKTYIENTWFTNINSYSSILEPSAGYCNDRTIRSSSSSTSVIGDTTRISTPYTTASTGITTYYFGPYVRNVTTSDRPTLGCPRSNADLYTTSSASNGNKQLAKPAALITADEAAFAGSGYNSSTTPYHAKTFLRSGSYFWLLSPYYRGPNGYVYGFLLHSNGYLSNGSVSYTGGVRPAISLKEGTEVSSGSGTATDPWVIEEPPKTMQSVTSSDLATLMPNTGDTTTLPDARDGQQYTIGKLADNNYWLLDDLALDLTDSAVLSAMDSTNTNASDTALGYLKNGGGTTSDKYATAKVANWTSSYSYSAPLVNMGYKNTVPTDATSTAGGYKIGGYYNYCAATAGSYCYGNGTSYGTSSGNATESICPKGWRLPTGNTSGEYQALYSNSNYNTYANYRAALHLPLSGYFFSSYSDGQGSSGRFWSSTRNDSRYMYRLHLDTSSIYPADNGGRNYGFSVRCVYGD